MKRTAHVALLAAVFILTGEATAQTPARLDASAAQKIVSACVEHSTRKKQSHAIAVVDSSGSLVAFLRMNGNPPGVGEFALQKAIAVTSWQFSTEQMAKSAETSPGFANAPKVVTVGGGLPIYAQSGGEFLGAVGVSGESAIDDAACAIAGLTAAGFKDARN